MKETLDDVFNALNNFHENYSKEHPERTKLITEYYNWIVKKTELILNEKQIIIPKEVQVQRGKVFWTEFGFNIGQEYGGRHPSLILKVGGDTAIVLPISTQEPTYEQMLSGNYVEIPKIYGFKNMRRWVNILNVQPISIKRLSFEKCGNVKGYVLDTIDNAFQISLFRKKSTKKVMEKNTN